MSRRQIAIALGVLLCVVPVLAEEGGGPPKPSPEQHKLGYFVGKWTATGTVLENPFMPAGPFKSEDDCSWFEGGYAVVCRSEGSGPMGSMKSIGIMGYSTEEKKYTYYGLDSGPMAMSTVPLGTVEADTWTFVDTSTMGGKPVTSRYMMTIKSPTSYDFEWAMKDAEGKWQTVMKGTATKGS